MFFSLSNILNIIGKIYIIALLSLILAGCTGFSKDTKNFPESREEIESKRIGKLTGEDGISFTVGSDGVSSKGISIGSTERSADKIGVNKYLWKASLDRVKHMPLLGLDPSSGIIITDWYGVSGDRSERYKFDIRIVDAQLKSEALQVSAFKQVLKGNNWRDAKMSGSLASDLEKEIFAKARELQAQSGKK